MSERSKHLFLFSAQDIAKAAKAECEYHQRRERYWREEYTKSAKRVEATAGVKLQEVKISGGARLDLVIDYGDVAAYNRMNEAWGKIQQHQKEAEQFATDAKTYASQYDRGYELDSADVLYYRLGAPPRPPEDVVDNR